MDINIEFINWYWNASTRIKEQGPGSKARFIIKNQRLGIAIKSSKHKRFFIGVPIKNHVLLFCHRIGQLGVKKFFILREIKNTASALIQDYPSFLIFSTLPLYQFNITSFLNNNAQLFFPRNQNNLLLAA